MKNAINNSLELISRRDRFVILIAVLAQTFLALFDLIGIGLIGVVVALGTSSISGITPPVITSLLNILGIEEGDRTGLLLWLSVSAAVLLVAKSIISFLIIRKIYKFLALRQALISRNLIKALLSRPVLFIQKITTGDVSVAIAKGAEAATLGVIGSSVVMMSEIPVLVVLSVGLSFVDVGVTVFTIVFFGLMGFLIHWVIARKGRKLGSQVSEMDIASLEAVQGALGSYKEIAVFGRQDFYVERIEALRWNAASAQGTLSVLNQSTKYIYETMLIVGAGLLLAVQLTTHDLSGALTIITVFMAAASRIVPSLLRLQIAALTVISSAGLAEPTISLAKSLEQSPIDLHEKQVNDSNVETHLGASGIPASRNFIGHVELRNIEFTYPGSSQQAISNFSLELQQGQSLALVGPTGAGKSTISDLILGLMQPDSGEVFISGESPNSIIKTNPGLISYVPQATSVVRGNIRDNVALGIAPELVDDDLVWEALERAQLADFLQSSRAGLETLVGERGVQLSGGQRQRLGLARALYTRPKLLVLDEATSALDAETEAAVTQALSALEGEVTTITVAHRLATIRNCDIIVFLEHGREVARGTFDELRKNSVAFNNQANLSGL